MFHTTKLWKELAVLIKGKYCTLEQSSFCPTALEVLHIYLYINLFIFLYFEPVIIVNCALYHLF